jgi:hypothetical protein
MKAHGYRKRALSWHRLNRETIQVFHAEKDRWGFDDYSFHLAIYIRACGRELTPPHYRCPIQTYLDKLVPNAKRLRKLSNFEDPSLDLERRLASIASLVGKYGLPWLDDFSSIQALRRLAKSDYDTLLPKVLIFRDTYDYLHGLPDVT